TPGTTFSTAVTDPPGVVRPLSGTCSGCAAPPPPACASAGFALTALRVRTIAHTDQRLITDASSSQESRLRCYVVSCCLNRQTLTDISTTANASSASTCGQTSAKPAPLIRLAREITPK